ncbi:MAG: hypothetical protein JST59_00235 [Actinobacteria bacterium]|nr:hypothetical protein [Actinomycetota bacterium]
MANLYKPRTIALAKMAALPRYRHPADLANEYQRPVSQQLRAINGEFEFDKGLYPNDRYEQLIKAILPLRSSFKQAVRTSERTPIAEKEISHWEEYVRKGIVELPKVHRH